MCCLGDVLGDVLCIVLGDVSVIMHMFRDG